jgi:hypothetical protein
MTREMFTPRSRAERMAEMTGFEVRFGVWMKMKVWAEARRWRRKILRGVAGGFEGELLSGENLGFWW